jgi:hypothetical protein
MSINSNKFIDVAARRKKKYFKRDIRQLVECLSFKGQSGTKANLHLKCAHIKIYLVFLLLNKKVVVAAILLLYFSYANDLKQMS